MTANRPYRVTARDLPAHRPAPPVLVSPRIRRVIALGSALLALAATVDGARAQTFTRITTGPHVTDGGSSRSVNWIDTDGDGDLDLFVSNGPNPGQNAFLYLNDGAPNWTFTKVTDSPIVQDAGRSDGATFGDSDNDGDLDALVSTWYGDFDYLYYGDGAGSFTKITDQAPSTTPGHSESCSWGDYDNDGLLDLYVANSGNASAEENFLYHNEGGGNFTQVLDGEIATDAYRTRCVNWVDYDDDGDVDLFAANEAGTVENLYRNDGGGVFTPITGDPIVTLGGSSFTSSWGDIDNDGDQDCYVGNHSNQADYLFTNDGDGTFTRITGDPIVSSAGYNVSSGWGDYDNDGDLDLFSTAAFGGPPKTNFLFTNQLQETGTLSFVRVTGIPLVTDTGWSYGFAWGDYDRDGDLDIFQARTFGDTENNALYRNDQSSSNHWLTFSLVGVESNGSGIGAKVRVLSTIGGDPVEQLRVVEGQHGYCGQNLELHFGLGDATVASTVQVEWPSGTIDILTGVAADQHLVVTEGMSTSSVGNDHGAQGLRLDVAPNPFRMETQLSFTLDNAQSVQLEMFDTAGRSLGLLANGAYPAGSHAVTFTPAGGGQVFFYRLRSDEGLLRSGRLVRQP